MCFDPLSATMAAYAAAATTTVSAGASYAQGQAQRRASQQAGVAAQRAAHAEEADVRRANARARSQRILQALSAGLDPGSGSAREVLIDSAKEDELTARRVRHGGSVERANMINRGRAAASSGTARALSGAGSAAAMLARRY